MSNTREMVDLIHEYMHHDDFNEFEKLLEENPECVFVEDKFDNRTLLHLAILEDDVKRITLLLKYGASIYTKTRMGGRTCLHYATKSRGIDILKMCLQHVDARGVDIFDNENQTPLEIAIRHGKTRAIDILLNAGACFSRLRHTFQEDGLFRRVLSKRHRTQLAAMVVLGILRFRRKPVVCRDMRNEIGKRIWETRLDEKWATKEGLRDSNLESSKKKSKK